MHTGKALGKRLIRLHPGLGLHLGFRLAITGLGGGLVLLSRGPGLQGRTEGRLIALLQLLLGDIVFRHHLIGGSAVRGVVQPLRRQRRRNHGRGGDGLRGGADLFELELQSQAA